MASIAGVSVGAFELPEVDGRVLHRSLGVAWSGTMKVKKFRNPSRDIVIHLRAKSDSTVSSLATALLAAQHTTVAIAPDSHVNLGNGAGSTVNAYWIDEDMKTWQKNNHNAWDIRLTFRYSS